MTNGTDADFFQVLLGQVREDPVVDLVIAEGRLVLFETQAPQPDHNVHEGAYNQQWRISSLLWHRVSSTTAPGRSSTLRALHAPR